MKALETSGIKNKIINKHNDFYVLISKISHLSYIYTWKLHLSHN
jgi:hypothetical protein